MRILLTGSQGFVGSHLMEELLKTDNEILGLSRQPAKNLMPGAKYKYLDLREPDWVDEIISEFKPEVVYHLAANSAESTGEHSPVEMTTAGYNTFFNVIAASIRAKSLKKFIYVSSAAVYGNVRTPYHEDTKPEPNDIYAVTKYANELSLQILAKTYGFDYVIVRPHNITGERQDYLDPTRNVVVLFMQLLRLGKKPKIYGDGSSTRCYTYVKDVAKGLINCLEVSNRIVNIGSDVPTSLKELYERIVAISGIQVEPEYLPPRGRDVDINSVDHTQAKAIFPNYEETPLDETLKRTWDWLSQQPIEEFKPKKKEIDIL